MASHDPRAFNPPMTPSAHDMLGMTSAHWVAAAAGHGLTKHDALNRYRAFFRDGILPQTPAEQVETNRTSAQDCEAIAPIVNTVHEHGTTKFIQRHPDGLETESVILPYRGSTGRPRNTLCVSSQIGCAMGCTFCETAQMGLMRNLTAAQIVGQWWAARHSIGERIDNIVFMGMGEPMDNLDSVTRAIAVLTDRNGPGLAPARISVSTVGRVAGILRLAELALTPGFQKLRLAVSINAPNDAIRSHIMPINRATHMKELMDAMLQWPTNARQRVLIEYVLIPGVNDALEHADELCAYLRPLTCAVNVIPYNPRRHSPWPAPPEASVRQFVQRIHENGQFVKRRQTLGRSVMAACGQLGNATIRGRRVIAER